MSEKTTEKDSANPDICPSCGYKKPEENAFRVAFCPSCSRDHELHAKLRELIEEWEEVSKWGNRENQSGYQKGLKDATQDHANRLQEVLDNHE